MLGHDSIVCDLVGNDSHTELASYFDRWLTFDECLCERADAQCRESGDDDWMYVEHPAHSLDPRHTSVGFIL